MTTPPIAPAPTRRSWLAAVLLVGLACSCTRPVSDPRAELSASLGGAETRGYLFALSEGESQTTSSLTNSAVLHPLTLDKGDTNLVLRYTRIEDRNAKTAKTYKAEVEKKGSSLTLLVTELGTAKIVTRKPFPAAAPGCGPPTFDSVNACVNNFDLDCSRGGALLCAANRTCEPQTAALTCCLTSGQIVSVHLIFNPTNPRCILRGLIGDIGGLVSTQG